MNVPKPEEKKRYDWSHRGRGKRVPKCTCGSPSTYSVEHDAYFCQRSGDWLETECSDVACEKCINRPKKGEVMA